jgi:ABC-2 type transport system ATP-binding protein
MTMNQPVISLDDVVKTFGTGHRAVDDISLRVPSGSIFGFIGLNGAGKTTTIRMISGLEHPDGGSIHLFGKPLDPADPDMRRKVGYVLDEPMYFDWMSAGEYLQFVGAMEGLDGETVEARTGELLQFFDLEAKGDERIESFSTGMKKKVSLAAAVIHTPELVILDEPLEGIDALAQNAIKETLAMMAARGTTIFITSHVLDTVERLCTDIAIIHRGRIVLECRTDEIRSRVKGALPHETYDSLEELFVDTVAGSAAKKQLSFYHR